MRNGMNNNKQPRGTFLCAELNPGSPPGLPACSHTDQGQTRPPALMPSSRPDPLPAPFFFAFFFADEATNDEGNTAQSNPPMLSLW